MLSLAYSPQARRPLDLRPQQKCVAGVEGPPSSVTRASSASRCSSARAIRVLTSPGGAHAPNQTKVHASPSSQRGGQGALCATHQSHSSEPAGLCLRSQPNTNSKRNPQELGARRSLSLLPPNPPQHESNQPEPTNAMTTTTTTMLMKSHHIAAAAAAKSSEPGAKDSVLAQRKLGASQGLCLHLLQDLAPPAQAPCQQQLSCQTTTPVLGGTRTTCP